PFGYTMAATEYNIIRAEIERFNSHRHQGQIPAVVPRAPGQVLDQRGTRTMAFDGGRDTPRHVHQREEISLREELAEHFEALLTATHPGQPIMHQCHTHREQALSEA